MPYPTPSGRVGGGGVSGDFVTNPELLSALMPYLQTDDLDTNIAGLTYQKTCPDTVYPNGLM